MAATKRPRARKTTSRRAPTYAGFIVAPDEPPTPGFIVTPDPAPSPAPKKRSSGLAIVLAVVVLFASLGAAAVIVNLAGPDGPTEEGGLLPGQALWISAEGVQPGEAVLVEFSAPTYYSQVPAALVEAGRIMVGVPLIVTDATGEPTSAEVAVRVKTTTGEATATPSTIQVGRPLPTYERFATGQITEAVLTKLGHLSAMRILELEFVQAAAGTNVFAEAIADERELLTSLLQTRYFVHEIRLHPTYAYDFGTRASDGQPRRIDAAAVLLSDRLLADWFAAMPDGLVHVNQDAPEAEWWQVVQVAYNQVSSPQSVLQARNLFGTQDAHDRALAMINTAGGALKLVDREGRSSLALVNAMAAPSLAAERVLRSTFDVIRSCADGSCSQERFDQLTTTSASSLLGSMIRAGAAIITSQGSPYAPWLQFGAHATDMFNGPKAIADTAAEHFTQSWQAIQQGAFWIQGRATATDPSHVWADACGMHSTLTWGGGDYSVPVPKAALGRAVPTSCSMRLHDPASNVYASDPMVVDLRDHPAGETLVVDPMKLKATPYHPTAAPMPPPTTAGGGGGGGGSTSSIVGTWVYERPPCDYERTVWVFGTDGTYSYDSRTTNSCDQGSPGGAPPAVAQGGCKHSGTYTTQGSTLRLTMTWHGPTCEPRATMEGTYTVTGNVLRLGSDPRSYTRG